MMHHCPITYELCEDPYSLNGLNLLSKSLTSLKPFPYTVKEQIEIAVQLASKLSIQGVQPKLSIILNVKKEEFEIVEKGGEFILKPPHHLYEELPQNEDLSMRLAQLVGIEIPLHGMIYNIDGTLSYFIKRFDRLKNQKVAVEDFSQLMGFSRETKYESSMEKVISVVDKYCTFPLIEKLKLFRLVIFNFLIGNEDMHLKNFSLITRKNKIEMSPAYDLINTSIIMKVDEEIALPLRGKKKRLARSDLIDYFGIERLGLSESTLKSEILRFKQSLHLWDELLNQSFLSENKRLLYKKLIDDRWKRLSNE